MWNVYVSLSSPGTVWLFINRYRNLFGVNEGYPVHDPVAVAAVLIGTAEEIPFYEWQENKSTLPKYNERFDVTVDTKGSFEEAKAGTTQTGRTVATVLKPGEDGVRIPRSMDVDRFWNEIESCISRADEINKRGGKLTWGEYRPE